jgi:alpha-mannosidase
VPSEAAGSDIVLLIDVNGEACVVDGDGNPRLGLTNINSTFARELGEPGKRVVPFAAPARGGERVELWADAGANDLLGERQQNGTLATACIARRNPELWALSYDFEVLHDLVRHLPESDGHARYLNDMLRRAADRLAELNDTNAAAARTVLAPALVMKSGVTALAVSAIGHAHMDLAWLWPIRETIRKTARTFATVLAFMDRYPDYFFGASQPQQYAWLKRHYPQLYQRVAARIAEGRWEPQGAMWVEADLNVSGGEALVRQLLYGKRFFREEFGHEITCLWEPDVFGSSGALPQLLVKSGVTCYMTQKLSWNLVTKHPHHTFWWQGIDGSKVLAHFPPEDTYNGPALPHAVLKATRNFIDAPVSDRILMLFGIGDGGGGPGEEHLERLARERDLAGLVPIVQEPARSFFDHIAKGADRYATWVGELYLERCQGCYTTQARNKRFNRKMELALRELEFACAAAAHLTGHPYPHDRLEEIWKEVLLYQFHDILPGSSITRVYDESLARYADLLREVEELTKAADTAIASAIEAGKAVKPVVIANSLSWQRTEWLKLEATWIEAKVPPMGYAVIDAASPTRPNRPRATQTTLENEVLRLAFDRSGAIVTCHDKEHARDVLAPGAVGNALAVYRDAGDAWDIPMDYRNRAPERFWLEDISSHEDGPRAYLRMRYRYGQSTLEQEVALHAGSRRINFVTAVDWRESGRMLRTSFPVSITDREATCGIQFGSIRRPTHADQPADAAKFEVCAHKWVDLSDGAYGVAILDDCKYGHHVRDCVLDLALLRSTHAPDPQADRAHHSFTYALYPHAGDHVAGGVVRAAYALNVPLRPLGPPRGALLPPIASWFAMDAPDIVIETVKQAEDGNGIIVRMYESAGIATQATLSCGLAVAAASMTNLMEEGGTPLQLTQDGVKFRFHPFEIHTVRLSPG